MKKMPQFLLRCSIFALAPIAANAAGTYYNNYSSPQQQRYNSSSYSSTMQRNTNYGQNSGFRNYNGGFNANSAPYSSARFNQNQSRGMSQAQPQQQNSGNQSRSSASKTKQGFFANAGVSREYAMWDMEMKESGSKLHYDNVNWYALDLSGGYRFNAGTLPMQVEAGLKFGFQGADSTMVDDDVTKGGYLSTTWCESIDANGNCVGFIGDQVGHAMSIGATGGGSMLGFNLGVGFTDAFKWGAVRMTPSVGYRYFKYKLKTKQNYGLAVDTAACFTTPDGETQCDPAIILYNNKGEQYIIWRDDVNEKYEIVSGYEYFDPGSTYYFEQPGDSHSYEVGWTGPYVAMDLEYSINNNNAVNGRIELGLPAYTSTGDQPYRFDWQHPKSVEDKGGFGDAFHLGLGANWMTAVSDGVFLSLGLTYDYYTVSGADAKTFLNQQYYEDEYNKRLVGWATEDEMLQNDPIARNIKQLEKDCPGWVCSSSGEVDSFYRSLGVRVGINAIF